MSPTNTNQYTKVKPYNENEAKTKQLSRMFNTISAKYDAFNDIMTWGMARYWRKKALLSLKPYNPASILDIATGTGDICIKAFQYLSPTKALGVDISDKMMEVGRQKVEKAGLSNKISFEVQDCASLRYDDASFDAATISFGIRNFEKLNESLQQIFRVLKPGGHLLILEMNEPQKGFLLTAYKLYTRIFVSLTARFLSNDKKAYDYLQQSMHVFASGEVLVKILEDNGFKRKTYHKFTFGVCSMYLVEKPL
ncbi:MAG: bifunctional demethylmenaquinone methyltransferase/2-methoxy-6-polyprenyl-1,4-benzoquinol methylase UbiE [Paludibacter sp.]|nr:bifunctional demethylmenaquinone methyltransferase/2-methoxy-6-polyprenyl-1,4-benzoquinol methylase UbiE [Paludibacter sp.]